MADDAPDDVDSALHPWLVRLSPQQRRDAEEAMEREPDLRGELAVFLADAREFDRWLDGLAPDQRVPIEFAVARNPDLREEVGVLIAGMRPSLRDAFLCGFQRAVVRPGPLSPLLEGLRGVAGQLRQEQRQDPPDKA